MSRINLMIDEENELTFQVNIQGTRPGQSKCRLMLESQNMSLSFDGQTNGQEVSVNLPPLDHVLKEGLYNMTLEVIVEDRYFEPLKFQGEFEKRLRVTAESVKIQSKPTVSTSASIIEVKRKSDDFNYQSNQNNGPVIRVNNSRTQQSNMLNEESEQKPTNNYYYEEPKKEVFKSEQKTQKRNDPKESSKKVYSGDDIFELLKQLKK